jgi:hypothetical protein
MLVTSTSDGAEPTIDYVMPKRCDRRRTHWHRVIREPATQDLAEPYALSLYAIMASCSKMFLYLLNFARILLRIGVRPSTKPPPLRRVAQ